MDVVIVCLLRPTWPSIDSRTGNEQGAMFCIWESNHSSVITLVVCHSVCGMSTYKLSSLRKGNEHHTYIPVRSMAPFTFFDKNTMDVVIV